LKNKYLLPLCLKTKATAPQKPKRKEAVSYVRSWVPQEFSKVTTKKPKPKQKKKRKKQEKEPPRRRILRREPSCEECCLQKTPKTNKDNNKWSWDTL